MAKRNTVHENKSNADEF